MRIPILFLCSVLVVNSVTAGGNNNCSGRNKSRAAQKTTVATPEENDYDITSVDLDLNLQNTSTDISGTVTTHARTLVSNFSVFAFELNGVLTIDSCLIDGKKYNVSTNGSVRKVTLSTPMSKNKNFTVQVTYHGTSPAGNGQFFNGGLNHVTLASGANLLYTLSDDKYSKDWWPCKQSILDKIDSVHMWMTVDDSLKAASNGLLKNVTNMPGNKLRYEWATTYPIDYYLVAIAIGPYKEYNYYMHFTDGSNDSMLVQNFIADSSMYMIPARKATLDSTGYMIDYFSKVYGKYPFLKEKYGHCMVPLNGGMEHQTMTFMSMSYLNTSIVAHELGHQWFGDCVTYGQWGDIWLSEGMATYTEQLYQEHFWGKQAAAVTRTNNFNVIMSQPNGSVWVDDTTDVNRIFDGRLTYYKGAAVAHMLRYLAPQDSLYFVGLRKYQQQFKYSNAVTADMKNIMEQTYNIPLDSFFRQWVYGEGFPIHFAKWAQANTVVHIKITQGTTDPSVKVFNMPLEVKCTSASGDTVVKFNITGSQTHFIFLWDKTMTGMVIDPDNNIVDKTSKIENDPSVLSVDEPEEVAAKIYPNPATDAWQVTNVLPGSALILSDINGRQVWSGTARQLTSVSATSLPAGCYILKVQPNGGSASYYKLFK